MKYRVACICLGILSFCAFLCHDALIGGSANFGKVENGKYYVGNHGHYTEVSKSAFQLSKRLEAVAVITFLIAFLLLLDMVLSKRKGSGSGERSKKSDTKKTPLRN